MMQKTKRLLLAIRALASLILLLGSLMGTRPVQGQGYYNRKQPRTTPQPSSKPSPSEKHSRGGSITPSTINTIPEDKGSSKNRKPRSPKEAAAESDSSDESSSIGESAADKGDVDEEDIYAQLNQNRHRAKLILGANPKMTQKYFVNDDDEGDTRAATSVPKKSSKKTVDVEEDDEDDGEEDDEDDGGEDDEDESDEDDDE